MINSININSTLKTVPAVSVKESHVKLESVLAFSEKLNSKKRDSSNYEIRVFGHRIMVDKGIAKIIVELNKKGYKTTCCCEGHKNLCKGAPHPERRKEYGIYSPVWIVFEDGCLPPYPPEIKGYPVDMETKPWAYEHARIYMGKYCPWKHGNPTENLFISFERYKRQRKNYSNGDVDIEHEKVLEEVLTWAKALPYRNAERNRG